MARHNGGWFKTHREAWDKDLSQNVYLWAIWNALLHMASWKESHIIWEGKQRILPPGSVVFSIKELAAQFKCSQSTISRWLNYLQETQRISFEKCKRGSLVTLCNWSIYQSEEQCGEDQTKNKVGAKCEQSGTYEEGKKERINTNAQTNLSDQTKTQQEGISQSESKNIPRSTSSGRKKNNYPPEFDKLYQLYPRHEGKKRGFEIYKRQILTPDDSEMLKKAIENYIFKKRKTHPDYLLHFGTFMSQWEDWLLPDTGSIRTPASEILKPKNLEDFI